MAKMAKMAKMLMPRALCLLSVVLFVAGDLNSFSPIDTSKYPSVDFYSKGNGMFTLKAGTNGNITFQTSVNHSIYYKGVDLLYVIKLVNSTPPIWDDYGTYGYLGVFRGLQKVSVFVKATDSEGLPLNYTVVAGDLPVGVSLHRDTGELWGLAPDIDTTYVFTIRATNRLGKFADAIFKMVIKNSHVCMDAPCKHEGTCVEANGAYSCNCLNPFGGPTCEFNCSEHSLGISKNNKIVHDAQMSAFNSKGEYFAYNGRIGDSKGWLGVNQTSWLQVDLGNQTTVHGAQMAGLDNNYHTDQYTLLYSVNGQDFEKYVSPMTGQVQVLKGSTSAQTVTTILDSPVRTRFVRFVPVSYGKYGPLMKVELLGCHQY